MMMQNPAPQFESRASRDRRGSTDATAADDSRRHPAGAVERWLLLWRMLREQSIPVPPDVDLKELAARAQRQLEEVESHRVKAGAVLEG